MRILLTLAAVAVAAACLSSCDVRDTQANPPQKAACNCPGKGTGTGTGTTVGGTSGSHGTGTGTGAVGGTGTHDADDEYDSGDSGAARPPHHVHNRTAYAPTGGSGHHYHHGQRDTGYVPHDRHYRPHGHTHGYARWHDHYWHREYSEYSIATYDYHSGSTSTYYGDDNGAYHGGGDVHGDHHDHDGDHHGDRGWVDGYGRSHGDFGNGYINYNSGDDRARAWHGYDADCPDNKPHH